MTRKQIAKSGERFHFALYKQERLRQATWSFNLLIGLNVASALVSFVGVLLLLFGDASAAAVTTVSGLTFGTVNTYWLKCFQDVNNRLDDTNNNSEKESNEPN